MADKAEASGLASDQDQDGAGSMTHPDDTIKTIFDPDVALEIKKNVRRVWERVRENKGLRQNNLAAALSTTQGAISKLINDDNGHPWTETHLKKFAEFCGVSYKELVQDNALLGFFRGWKEGAADVDENFIDECVAALTRYYSERGVSAPRHKLSLLAARVATDLDGQNPDKETMRKAVERVILVNAMEAS